MKLLDLYNEIKIIPPSNKFKEVGPRENLGNTGIYTYSIAPWDKNMKFETAIYPRQDMFNICKIHNGFDFKIKDINKFVNYLEVNNIPYILNEDPRKGEDYDMFDIDISMKFLELDSKLHEIKINNPNIFFKQNGEIIDDDGETIWVDFSPTWNPNQKIYSSYSVGGNKVNLGLFDDEDKEVFDNKVYEFETNLKKRNIKFIKDTDIGLANYWIPKKHFDLPK